MLRSGKIINLLIFLSLAAAAQKPPLNHSVYDKWESINQKIISRDGKWIAFTVNPQEGDNLLILFNSTTSCKDTVPRGSNPVFSPESKYIACFIVPSITEIRQAKKMKLKEDQMPKNSLEIRNLENDSIIRADRVKSFLLPERNSFWMAYLHEKTKKEPESAVPDSLKSQKESGEKKKTPPGSDPEGADLVIINPVLNKSRRFTDVTEYTVARDGKTVSFMQSIPDTGKINTFRISVFDTEKETVSEIFAGKGGAKKLTSDKSGNLVSFIYSGDTARVKVYDLWLSRNISKAVRIVDSSCPGVPSGWSVSENAEFVFSDSGKRLYFGTAPKPVREPADTIPEEEKYKLDIWSWTDDLLQPMQKKRLEQEKKRTYQAVYFTDKGFMLQLADSAMISLKINYRIDKNFALGSSDLKYRRYSSWDSRNFNDYYIVDLLKGTRRLILEKQSGQTELSPSGKHLLYWNSGDRLWEIKNVSSGDKKSLMAGQNYLFFNETHDTPNDPPPYGLAGWLDDDNHVLVYDRYDIWSFSLDGKIPPVCITNGLGRKNNLRFRYVSLEKDAEYISRKNPVLLSGFDYISKESGFYSLKSIHSSDPVKLIMEKATFSHEPVKAEQTDRIIWQKESFDLPPDLYLSDIGFTGQVKISSLNNQQKSFNWITAELVEWVSFDNKPLQGILYKPEDFNPEKKYPMIVYFYERSSDGIFSYIPPAPSASIINRTFAGSNGYLVFVPDIVYETGYPGQSCYNCVVSGVMTLTDRFSFIDRDRIGLDGQSWGGYQVAWIVTRTDLFRCAYSGAPVSNMISAYGGIRWESGMSRMFQYEHTQSRIGGTLWEKPFQFIENSPIFFVPRINTPLLIMHNDADGAVPWYQGIEFFTALRRLGKPAWLLSYNDEAHNLMKRPNRKDLSVRKMQFFDHYLKNAPPPYWMKYGITQIEKGKKDGYELIEESVKNTSNE